jgi:Sulfotransferase family
MRLTRRLAAGPQTLFRELYSRLPFPGISNPIFIIGCGRSGTTILGTSLSTHRNVTYLNEPRSLWFSAFPETDIWTSKASVRNGRLSLTEADVDSKKSRKLSRLFRFETIRSRRPVLVEKLPVNTFRLEFIHRIFRDALFIHIFRNGLEVASSIENESNKGNWFGAQSYKWSQLADYAKGKAETSGLPALCTTYRDMGLLEWRLSTEAAVAFLRRLPDTTFAEISYDEFVAHPVETVLQLQAFIGVERDPNVAKFVSSRVTRQSRRVGQIKLSENDRILGGKLLPLSMDGGKALTRRGA